MNSQTSDISTGIRLAMGTGMCLWDMLYRRSTRPEEEKKSERAAQLSAHEGFCHDLHSDGVQSREKTSSSLGSAKHSYWLRKMMTKLFKSYKVARNVILNTFRSLKTMCTVSLDLKTYSNKMFSADRKHRAVRVVGGCWYWGENELGCPAHKRALWHIIGSEMFRISQPEFTYKVFFWRKTLELEVRGQDSSGVLHSGFHNKNIFWHYKV